MSKGQVQLLRQILGAGRQGSDLPLAKVRQNFDRLLERFPSLDDVDCRLLDECGFAEKVKAEWIDARRDRSSTARSHILYLHGGGFVLGSLNSHRQLIARLSRASEARCLGVEYRKAPEHPFPAALEDALNAFRQLRRESPGGPWVLAGDSAGAGLAVLTASRLRDLGEPLPSALVCFSPWTDYRGSGSVDRHRELDPLVDRPGLIKMAGFYLGDREPDDPEVSPLHTDLSDLPPMLVQAGGDEALLDDAVLLHERATVAGVDCELDVWPDMIHVWQIFAGRLDEGREAIESAGRWIRSTLR